MKQHKWHKEIKAWADGGDVQFNAGGDWYDWSYNFEPHWDVKEYEFRVKPEPFPDVIKYLNMIVNNYGTTVDITDTIDDNPQWEIRIKLTLDGETNKPKSVELIGEGDKRF